ncbi:hypothetical protein J4427_00315 [Candidatus Woesearchaeota archaeon]|nr:hypothetical protein [Candidatus Woesearchaeota archaeon]
MIRVWDRTLSAEEIRLLNNSMDYVLSAFETNTGDVWHANITINDGTGTQSQQNPITWKFFKLILYFHQHKSIKTSKKPK